MRRLVRALTQQEVKLKKKKVNMRKISKIES